MLTHTVNRRKEASDLKGKKRTEKRKLSTGTVFMLILLVAVLCGSVLVLGRLSSGVSFDLSKLSMSVLNIQEDPTREDADNSVRQPEAREADKKTTAMPAARETQAPQSSNSFTLTLGGSISLSGEVRKNSRSTDAKVADYADVMMLLAPRIHSDVNCVFLENILSDRLRISDTVAPSSATILLKEAGFNMAACGFSSVYSSGKDGIEETLKALESQGLETLGIRSGDSSFSQVIKTVNGVRAAFLQYTATVPAKTRKSMVKDGTSGMVPEAEASLILQDITTAREAGAETVIVLISWGRTGKDPDKAQRELAEKIAQAGADLIVGNGSHVPQSAEYLHGRDGKQVLCVWSLGTMLDGDRTNIKRLSGYLLHVTIQHDRQRGTEIINPEYTPVYTWKYKQDGRYYYRCIASDGEAPDGMDNEQRKTMNRSKETVAAVLQNSPLKEKEYADGV